MKILRTAFFFSFLFFYFIPLFPAPSQTWSVQANAVSSEMLAPVASPSAAPSIEYALPYPGLLPGHPLYPVKQLRDHILLLFARNPAQKCTLLLFLSDKKLAMAMQLWESQKQELAVQTLKESHEHMLEGSTYLVTLKKENTLPVGLAEKYRTAHKKHEEIHMTLVKTAPSASIRQRLEHEEAIMNEAKQYILSVRE